MSELSKHMNCYILAGGQSSRMGIDKGLIQLNGKAIVQHVIDKLKPLFKNVIIVSNNKEYSKFGLETISDIIKDSGPAGGIYTALTHSNTGNNFIVSCDMPFITLEAVKFVISESASYQITVPIHHQKYEPLFAQYSTSCKDKWKQEIDKGVFKLQNIMTKFNVLELNVEGNPLFNDVFTNINTKEDLEKAVKKLSHGN